MAVFAVGGAEAFWQFHDLVFANQRELSAENYLRWAVMAGVDGAKFADRTFLQAARVAKVDEDLALATRLGIRGTPVFRINGVPLMGAQPMEISRRSSMDSWRRPRSWWRAARPPARSTRCSRPETAAAPAEADTRPSRGHGHLARAGGKVRSHARAGRCLGHAGCCSAISSVRTANGWKKRWLALEQKYGTNLRIVWKDYPLPFHDRAFMAAVLARVALAKKGAKGFWQAHDALFAGQDDLDDGALKAIAKGLACPGPGIQRAMPTRRFKDVFEASEDLAKTLKVSGTPCAFVNGYRVAGAVPAEKFVGGDRRPVGQGQGHGRRSPFAGRHLRGHCQNRPANRRARTPEVRPRARGSASAKVTVVGDARSASGQNGTRLPAVAESAPAAGPGRDSMRSAVPAGVLFLWQGRGGAKI